MTSFRNSHLTPRSPSAAVSRLGAFSLLLALSACGADSEDSTEAAAPSSDLTVLASLAPGATDPCLSETQLTQAAFYRWNKDTDTLPAQNGALVRCQRLNADSSGYTKYRVLYKTSTLVTNGGVVSELPLVASGQIYVPTLSAADTVKYTPNQDQPVLANTHGAVGVIAQCGPSLSRLVDSLPAMRDLSAVVGPAVLAIPDYIGLGVDHGYRVPDAARKTVLGAYAFDHVTHPFVSIESEGRATIDLVRVTKSLPGTLTSDKSKWLVTGVSQGGHAALATAEVYGRGYGTPGPILRGAIAGAPASELDNWNMWTQEAIDSVFAMVTAGMTLENRDFTASSLMNEPAITAFAGTTNKSCFTTVEALFEWAVGYAVSPYPSIFQTGKSPFQNPTTIAVLQKNSPGRVTLKVPVFIGQLVGDPLIFPARTDIMVDRSRTLNKNTLTFCRYDSVVTGSSAAERAQNHNAYRRMFPQNKSDGTPVDVYTTPACYDSSFAGSVVATGSDPTPNTGIVITPVAWAKNVF